MESVDPADLWRQLTQVDLVPVCRPRLPPAAALVPYLERMDLARRYSNHGPLVVQLQQRLSGRMGGAYVALASSGTSAIAGAVLAAAGRARADRSLCLMPANTFIGSVSAVEQCGYTPWFVDVDEDTWQLTPDILKDHPMLGSAGLVLVVSAYGRAVPQRPWERFREETGIPVVIDGAAMIEAAMDHPETSIGTVPVALSFHATKSFATGEGGAVVTTAEEVWIDALKAMNFGYDFDRMSKVPSLNAKMSEYHAAVGLAELDGWEQKRASYRDAAARLRAVPGLAEALVTAPQVSSCYAIHVAATPQEGQQLRRSLALAQIGTRQWYGGGAHRHPYTLGFGRDEVPVSERLAEVLTGLPMSVDLGQGEVDLLANVVADHVRATA